ncbi:hypothetical protein PRVXH_001238 [Proteinivorax hydrogeniformans]|uniref:O-antigen ligase-like membrane protein n=1 Tax=Proteinivorax hydrogeniformans TaxID=1826727 RepID=A0AAU8HWY6_9FIRM
MRLKPAVKEMKNKAIGLGKVASSKITEFNHNSLTILLLLLIPPSMIILGYNIPVIYFLMPIFAFVFIAIVAGWIKKPKITRVFIALWGLIICQVLISGILGPIVLLDVFSFPNEVLQYVTRFLVFVGLIAIIYNSKISESYFIKIFSVVSLTAMAVGILQWIPWIGQEFMLRSYAMVDREIGISQVGTLVSRVPGIARHATSTGGLAAFIFMFSLSMLLTKNRYWMFGIVGIVFSILNLIAAQARGGMLAVAVTFMVIYFVDGISKRKIKANLLKMLLVITVVLSLLVFLYNQGNPHVVQGYDRWGRLFDQIADGGNRYSQITRGLSLLDSPYTYIFGVSRGFQVLYGFMLEVEFLNILVLYGLSGFVLQYGLVLFLLYYFYKNLRLVAKNNTIYTLTLASFSGLFSYQVFSTAYYFFREINVGLYPWVFFGITIGLIERYKRNISNLEK